jgi:hypothetical protein
VTGDVGGGGSMAGGTGGSAGSVIIGIAGGSMGG